MSKKLLVVGIAIAGAIAWYAFRPERLFVNQSVNENLPQTVQASSQSKALYSGRFHAVAHETSGVATVHELAGGKRVLRFTDFKTSNGPDVQVYLVAADDATDSDTVKKAGFVHIGALKGNIGDQNYEIGPEVDLNKYRAVSVWCRRFGVNFGTAPLMGTSATSQPKPLYSGRFHGVAHETSGVATVHGLAEGRRILRFSEFKTSNGPDVQVYLVAADDATDSDTVKKAGFIHIGALKGNIGDQNYEIASNVDLTKYRAVSVWCRRFGVNFGTAPLKAQN